MANPEFLELLNKMREVHNSKAADYAIYSNPYSNFEEAALIAGITVNQQFLALIGTKISRIKNLLASGKKANNESLDDSLLDLAVYCTLMAAYNASKIVNLQSGSIIDYESKRDLR